MSNLPQIALIGNGAWGKNHCRVLRELGVLRWVYDADSAMLQGCPERTSFIDKVWEDERTQGVVIATPPGTHAALAIQAFKAGKHVLVEKPMAMNVVDCAAMTSAAIKAGRLLMVGHLMRHHDGYDHLYCHANLLGQLEYIYSHRLQPGRVRSDVSSLWSLAPHDVDMMIGIVGMPVAVSCMQGVVRQAGLADIVTAAMEFPEGVRGHIFISWLHPTKHRELVVIGHDGAMVMDQATVGEPLRDELINFLHDIEHGALAASNAQNGLDVVRVLAACDESMRRGGARVQL